MEQKVVIHTEYITLGQLLKRENIVPTGGMVKAFLSEYQVRVNSVPERRRGKKLYPNDVVEIEGIGTFRIVRDGN